jgi:flagellar protein FlbT
LSQVFTDSDSRSQLARATAHLTQGHVYNTLKALRSLLPREERLMAAHGT